METEEIKTQEVIGARGLKPVPAINLIIHAWSIADTYQNSVQDSKVLRGELAKIAMLLNKVIRAS